MLSHWPHVATHVATQVADARQFHSPEVAAARRLVAESLATCAATCVATCLATCGQCESTISGVINFVNNGEISKLVCENA